MSAEPSPVNRFWHLGAPSGCFLAAYGARIPGEKQLRETVCELTKFQAVESSPASYHSYFKPVLNRAGLVRYLNLTLARVERDLVEPFLQRALAGGSRTK